MRRSCLLVLSIWIAAPAAAQLKLLRTDDFNVIYFGSERFLAPHVARAFENALAFHKKAFGYTLTEPITLLLHDFGDYGNAGASAIPNNRILITIAPFSYVFEVVPGNERMNWMATHELVHIIASDQAAPRDRFYRRLFGGKVAPASRDPISFFYSYLTSPRSYAPRWYHEGAAVFMETWMTGGYGRALGGYDEMAFRAMVADGHPIYDLVGLESAATKLDFQVGVNAYLYGTRFMSYLAHEHGPETIIQWVSRHDGSQPSYGAQFRQVFKSSLSDEWSRWIAFEHAFQQKNLERLRANPITPFTPLTKSSLGSVSRVALDRSRSIAYLAVNYPGQVAHLASIDLASGAITRIRDLKGPALFSVTSLAYDPASRQLFYTTNNNDWRDLRVVDLDHRTERLLIKGARVGDLALNPVDRSLWGVRHYNGISTIVRIPPPYTEWNQLHSLPYGTDVFDLDISPDGTRLSAAMTRVDGSQSLVLMDTSKLLGGDTGTEVLQSFDNASPSNFVFSPDGRYLYGSSYYSGASNIYRYDLANRDIQPLSNADTGFFRPVPLPDGKLLAFHYGANGFTPVLIDEKPVEKIAAVTFLGQEVVERWPVVKEWKLPPPSTVNLGPLTRFDGDYSPFKSFRLRSWIPIVEGYKNFATYGFRTSFTDDVGYNRFSLAASYSPYESLPSSERLHLDARYEYLGWKVTATLNNADFYDLFGPTKRSYKGYSLGVEYTRYLIFDEPNRSLDYDLKATGYGDLETLPGYQNVASSASRLVIASASVGYKFIKNSLGSVEPEKGLKWRAKLEDYVASGQNFPRVNLDFDLGASLPLPHSSLWLRSSLGKAWGDRQEPIANFYFGGFGNNWVDDKPYRHYQESESFPGLAIDEIGGRTYAKTLLEWNLPPVTFRHAGTPAFFLNWTSLAIFAGGLVANPEDAQFRRKLGDVGAQLDVRFIAMSHHQFTLSFGYAVAFETGQPRKHDFMTSLRIPIYE